MDKSADEKKAEEAEAAQVKDAKAEAAGERQSSAEEQAEKNRDVVLGTEGDSPQGDDRFVPKDDDRSAE